MTATSDNDQLSNAIDTALRSHRRKWLLVFAVLFVAALLFVAWRVYVGHQQRVFANDARIADYIKDESEVFTQDSPDGSAPPQGLVQRMKVDAQGVRESTAWATVLPGDVFCSDGKPPWFLKMGDDVRVRCGSVDYDNDAGKLTLRDARTGVVRYPAKGE